MEFGMNSGGCLLPAVSWDKRLISAMTYKKTLLIGLLAGPSITHRAEEEETVLIAELVGGSVAVRGHPVEKALVLRELKSIQITSSDTF